jgi:hypothetical protein
MLIRTASLVLPHEYARLIDPVDRQPIARLPTLLTVDSRSTRSSIPGGTPPKKQVSIHNRSNGWVPIFSLRSWCMRMLVRECTRTHPARTRLLGSQAAVLLTDVSPKNRLRSV